MANGDAFADVEHVPDETTPRSLSATPGGGDTGEDHVGGAADGHQEIRAVPSNTSLSGSYVSSVDVDDPPIVQEEPGALPVADGNGGNDANDDDRDGDDDILSKVAQSDIGDDAIEERTSTVAVGQQAESDIYQAHASGSGGTGNAHGVCTVRVAQVERDYRRGFACEFRTEIPPQLQGKVWPWSWCACGAIGKRTGGDSRDHEVALWPNVVNISCHRFFVSLSAAVSLTFWLRCMVVVSGWGVIESYLR